MIANCRNCGRGFPIADGSEYIPNLCFNCESEDKHKTTPLRRDGTELAAYDAIVVALVSDRGIVRPDEIHETAAALIQKRREFSASLQLSINP